MIKYETILNVVLVVSLLAGILTFVPAIRSFRYGRVPNRRLVYISLALVVLANVALVVRIIYTTKALTESKPEIQEQINRLSEIEHSLSDLRHFVDSQKRNLSETESRLRELNKERERIKPILEAEKTAIEALFLFQEERNRSKVWTERLFGAAFGVLSSLIATLIYKLITGPRSREE